MPKKSFYSFKKCHFCNHKLKSNYISFAKLTDYTCSNDKCSRKFGYYVCYDDVGQNYYEAGFTYKDTSFQFMIDRKIYKTIINTKDDSYSFDGEILISNVKDISVVIKKMKNLSLFK